MALFHTTVVDNQIKALDTIGSASGSIATFDTDRAERLVSCVCEVASGSSEINVTACGKNLFPLTLTALKAINTSGTWSDNVYTYGNVSYTVNNTDDIVTSIETSGTCNNSYAYFYLTKGLTIKSGKTYSVSGSPVGKASNTYRIFTDSNVAFPAGNRLSDDIEADQTRTATGNENVDIFIQIYAGQNMNDKSFYPMLVLGSDISTFVAYNGTTYNIQFGETLSGNGSFDVLSGILTRSDDTTKHVDGNEITTQVGTNNIYADTGDIIDLKFVLSVGKAIS